VRLNVLYRYTVHGWFVLVPAAVLVLLGLMAIFAVQAAEPQAGLTLTWDSYLVKQLAYLLGGVGALVMVLLVPYQRWGEMAYPLFAVTLVSLIALCVARVAPIPVIPEIRNTYSWIRLGPVQLQPSEFAKIAYILALARYLRHRKNYRRWWGLLGPFALTVVPMSLILVQPDLGTVLQFVPVLFIMLFAAGAKVRHLGLVALLGLLSLPGFYIIMRPHQRARFEALLKQNTTDARWHANEGYQLRQSKIAVGTGRLTGTFGRYGFPEGLLDSPQFDYSLLPDRHNDFVFAVIAHFGGFAGAMLLLACYAVIVVAGVEIATLTNDPFGRLTAVGVVGLLGSQMLINVGMTIGLMPITGLTLPLVSYGGSSLVTSLVAIGLLINVAQRRPMLIAHPPFEFTRGDEDA
jgi:rod shape determining protein RodA